MDFNSHCKSFCFTIVLIHFISFSINITLNEAHVLCVDSMWKKLMNRQKRTNQQVFVLQMQISTLSWTWTCSMMSGVSNPNIIFFFLFIFNYLIFSITWSCLEINVTHNSDDLKLKKKFFCFRNFHQLLNWFVEIFQLLCHLTGVWSRDLISINWLAGHSLPSSRPPRALPGLNKDRQTHTHYTTIKIQ